MLKVIIVYILSGSLEYHGSSLRISIVTYRPLEAAPTGSRRIILDLASGLHSRGVDVTMYTIVRRGVGCPREKRYSKVACIEIDEDVLRRLLLLPYRALSLSSGEALLFLKLISQFYVDKLSKAYYELARIIASENPNIVFLETLYTTFIGTMMSSMGIPTVLRTHNVEAEYIPSLAYAPLRDLAYRYLYLLENKFLRMHKNIVTISVRDSKILERLYNVKTIYLGPSLNASRRYCRNYDCDVIKHYGLKCRDYILFVGSLHKPNVDAILSILNAYSKDNFNFDLVVVGSICKYIDKLGITNDKIKVLGIVPDDILRSIYCCSEGSLAPILSGGGVPIKLVESLLYGIPTITSKRATLIVPGLIHGENVLIIEEVGGLSEALRILVTDETLRERLSRGATELTEKVLGYEVTINRYLKYLNSIARMS